MGRYFTVTMNLFLVLFLTSIISFGVLGNIGESDDGSVTVGVMSDTEGPTGVNPDSDDYNILVASYAQPAFQPVSFSEENDYQIVIGSMRHLLWNYPTASGNKGPAHGAGVSFMDGGAYVSCPGERTGEVCESDPLGNERLIGDGVCVENVCAAGSDDIMADCEGSSCESSVVSEGTLFYGCDATTGFACDDERAGYGNDAQFMQDGLCARESGTGEDICYTGGSEGDHVCLDEGDSLYKDSCSVCGDGAECTTALTSGNFESQGICNQGSCCPMSIEDSGACECSEDVSGNRCDIGGTGEWDGVCAADNDDNWACAESTVYYDGEFYRSEYDESYDGYVCGDALDVAEPSFPDDPYERGLAADGECRFDEEESDDRYIECPEGAGSDCYNQCGQGTGDMCTTYFGTDDYVDKEFDQTGLCTLSTCAEGDHVCYDEDDDVHYDEACGTSECTANSNQIAEGISCDSNPTTGGNYDADGLCTMDGCSTEGGVCINQNQEEGNDRFYQDCNSCVAGSLCEVDSTTEFSATGYCGASECAPVDENQPYVDTSGNEKFDDEPEYCGNSEDTRNQLCSVNVDHEWDGLCIENSEGWHCNEEIVTCRFDYYTEFDSSSDCEESTLNSTISESGTFEDSFVGDSEVSFSAVLDSQVSDSDITGSTVEDSLVTGSDIDGSTFSDSIIFDSEACEGMEGSDVRVSDNVLVSGVITYNGNQYSAPYRMEDICDEAAVGETGFLSFNTTAAADGSDIEIIYSSSGSNYDVVADATPIDGPSSLELEEEDAGEYIGVVEDIDVGGSDDSVEITAQVTSSDSTWDVSADLNLHNSPPSGSIDLVSLLGDEDESPSSTVILESSYSDPIGVDGCRIANEEESALDDVSFSDCTSSRYWDLLNENGTRTVYMEIRNTAGLTTVVDDDIELDTSLSTDTEPPTRPRVLTDHDYTNQTDTLEFRWYNSTDTQQTLLGNPIFYDMWLCRDDYDNCEYKNYTTSTEVTLTDLSLESGSAYYLRVAAFNIENLYSLNSTGGPVRVDEVPPEMPSIDTYVEELDSGIWNDGDNISFEFSSSDPGISGIEGYSTSVSRSDSHTPDSFPDSDGNVTYDYLPDGYYTFRVRAVDRAGNLGPENTYDFKVTSTQPTVPQMLNRNYSVSSGSSTITFRWTDSSHISGIVDYQLQVSSDLSFEDLVLNQTVGNNTQYTHHGFDDDTYFARVRSVNSVGEKSRWSDEVSDTLQLVPPEVTFMKPDGVIVSENPTLVVRTNEIAYCTYDTDGQSERLFDVTNLRNHESRISVEEGSHTFDIMCTDAFGNEMEQYEMMEFEVDTSREPNSLSMEDDSDILYSGTISSINFSVMDSGVGLGEVNPAEFEVDIDGETYDIMSGDLSIADVGGGEYQLGFVVSEDSDEVDVEITHMPTEVSDSMEYEIRDLELDTGCDEYCDLISTDDPDREEFDEYNIVIGRDEADSLIDIHQCPDSEVSAEDANCIRIESTGSDSVCMAFDADCDDDSIAQVIDG